MMHSTIYIGQAAMYYVKWNGMLSGLVIKKKDENEVQVPSDVIKKIRKNKTKIVSKNKLHSSKVYKGKHNIMMMSIKL